MKLPEVQCPVFGIFKIIMKYLFGALLIYRQSRLITRAKFEFQTDLTGVQFFSLQRYQRLNDGFVFCVQLCIHADCNCNISPRKKDKGTRNEFLTIKICTTSSNAPALTMFFSCTTDKDTVY